MGGAAGSYAGPMLLALVPRLALALTFGQTEAAGAAPADPAAELKECDAILADRKRETARACYEVVRLGHPGTPEAHDAERAVALIAAMPADPTPQPAGARRAPADPSKPGFYVMEPYSHRTNERLRLSTWEKLDFGTTAFLYGLATGAAFSGAIDSGDSPLPAMVTGSLLYTGLAVAYVNTATLDRGDLPLVLAITSYLPITAGLVTLTTRNESDETAGGLIAGSALVSLPLAYWAAASTDLDPGDTQLVRDLGFWCGVWGVTGALSAEFPTDRSVGVAGLIGLYGGLGLGLLVARTTNVSLERVRVSTWGGYGGAIVGGLIGLTSGSAERGPSGSSISAGVAVGSGLGLLITFLATSSIDNVPADAQFQDPRSATLRYLQPALLPVVERDGRTRPRPGLQLVRGTF